MICIGLHIFTCGYGNIMLCSVFLNFVKKNRFSFKIPQLAKLLKFDQLKKKFLATLWVVPSNVNIFLFFHQSSLTILNYVGLLHIHRQRNCCSFNPQNCWTTCIHEVMVSTKKMFGNVEWVYMSVHPSSWFVINLTMCSTNYLINPKAWLMTDCSCQKEDD